MTWWQLLTHWDVVQADLARLYHVNEWQVQDGPWPWLRALICDLAANPDAHTHHLFTHTHA